RGDGGSETGLRRVPRSGTGAGRLLPGPHEPARVRHVPGYAAIRPGDPRPGGSDELGDVPSLLPNDRLAERHIANRVLGGRARLPVLGDTPVELQELALERRLERDRLDGPPRAGALLASTLQPQLDRRAAKERRGNEERRPPLEIAHHELQTAHEIQIGSV